MWVGLPGRWMRVIQRGLGRYREMLGDVVGDGGRGACRGCRRDLEHNPAPISTAAAPAMDN